MNYWPLLGIALVVIGFALRFNPLMVVVGAALVTGLLAGFDFVAVVEALGKAFNDNRYIFGHVDNPAGYWFARTSRITATRPRGDRKYARSDDG